MMTKIHSYFIQNKKRAIALILILAAIMLLGLGGTLAYHSDRIKAQIYLTIATWKGDPVLKQWNWDAASDFHAYKSTITSVTFLEEYDETVTMDAGPWDVSHAEDESVMAYMVGNAVYIASNVDKKAQVIANPYSSYPFYNFSSMTTVNNADSLDTSIAITMKGMFYNCSVLSSINGMAEWDTTNVTDMSTMFYMCTTIPTLDVQNFKTDNVENMAQMFFCCNNLLTVDISTWDTGKVEDMNRMFYCCNVIDNLNTSNLKTGKVTDMHMMFAWCMKLSELDVSTWDTGKVKDMNFMFAECSLLETLDVSGWDTKDVTNMESMFTRCTILDEIDISSWDMSSVTNTDSMLRYCSAITELTIPDSLETIDRWFASECAALTTINFLHEEGKAPTFPTAGKDTGAFYVTNYVPTKITGIDEVQAYDWITDHRRSAPVIRSYTYTWDDNLGSWGQYVAPEVDFHTSALLPTIKEVVFEDQDAYWGYPGMVPGDPNNIVDDINVWDVSEAQDKSVIAWIDANNKLTIAANGPKVIANEDSSMLFALLDNVETIDATKYDTSQATSMAGWHWFNDPDGDYADPDIVAPMTGAKTIKGTETWDVSNVTDFNSMFHNAKNLTSIDVSEWDTGSAIYMDGMFMGCGKLTSLDVSSWDVGNVVTMEAMFSRADGFTSLPIENWDVHSLQDLTMTFADTKIQSLDLTNWNTENLLYFTGTFMGSGIETLDISNWKTTNLYSTEDTFKFTKNLKTLDLSAENGAWNTGALVYASSMFEGSNIETVDMTGWDFSVCERVWNMFQNAAKLENVIGEETWTTEGWVWMSHMFDGCESLQSLDVADWYVGNVNGGYGFESVFRNCKLLETLDVSEWTVSSARTFEAMFMNCESLKSIDISAWDMAALKYEQLDDMFNGCKTLTELTFPAKVNFLAPRMGANCPNMTTIEFLCTGVLKEVVTPGESRGAFYVSPDAGVEIPVLTDLITHSDSMLTLRTDYDWGIDNRCFATPELAARSDWWTQGSPNNAGTTITQSEITSIELVDLYGTEDKTIIDQWDASTESTGADDNEGPITAYLEHDDTGITYKLTIAGNGSGYILANEDSRYAFGGTYGSGSTSIRFSKATSITGLDILDTGNVKDMFCMFFQCMAVETLDVSSWDTSAAKGLDSVFYWCKSMTDLDISTKSVTLNGRTYDSWDTGSCTDMGSMFMMCQSLESVDISHFDTADVTDFITMFDSCNAIETINITPRSVSMNNRTFDSWDTGSATEMKSMFRNCNSLTSVDVSKFDTADVQSMYSMFYNCYVLPELDVAKKTVTLNNRLFTAWDTGNVTSMKAMFYCCNELDGIDMQNWDATSVETMKEMFYNCYALADLNLTDVSTSTALTDLSYTFYYCESLPSIDLSSFTTSEVTTMEATFFSCYGMETMTFGPDFDGSSVETVRNMFCYCSKLKTIDLENFNTSNALTNMYRMFENCRVLEPVDLTNFDTSKVTNMANLFYKCYAMTTIDLSMFDTSSVTTMSAMFNECNYLKTIYASDLWTTANVLYSDGMFSNCYDIVGQTGRTYDSANVDTTYANYTNGYLTYKAAPNAAAANTLNLLTDETGAIVSYSID